MLPFFQKAGQSLQSLLYPALCLHCQEDLSNPDHLLCEQCLELMELIDPTLRCPHCFSADYISSTRVCADCLKHPRPVLDHVAAAFEFIGPAATLIKEFKYADQTYLGEGCAAYMAAQFLSLKWPMPDLIVPVPLSLSHWFVRGYNQSELIAHSLANLLQCPVQNALKRKSGAYSQAGLSYHQRLKIDGEAIQIREDAILSDQIILLVDDVMTTGSTLQKCAEALSVGYPKKIYGLTFCCA